MGFSKVFNSVCKKNIFVCFLFLTGAVFSTLVQAALIPNDPVPEVHFVFRALEPGEVIEVSIEDDPDISSAYVRVFGKKYPLGRAVYSEKILAVIGLDLDLKPGTYLLDVYIIRHEGHADLIRKRITVMPKQFPVKKLWVDEKYVTPPAEARERIQRESIVLSAVFDIFSHQWTGNGRFVLPLEGRPAHNFGERRIFNNKPRSPHSGEDISAPSGTEVRASNSGRVVLASNLYFAGNTVIIDHGLRVFTFYCHFSNIRVKRGQNVEKGDVIGEVGATGRVTGPHLHWSVRVNGSRVDPYSLLYLLF